MTEAASSDLALLSHELRTPIAAIMGLADGMVEAAFGPLNATYREHAALIHQAGDHLLALADNLAGDGLRDFLDPRRRR